MPGMTPETDDDRIGEKLRADAPAAHDPLFRLSVMERRERKRFRNRSLQLAAVGLALGVVALIGISIGERARDAVGVIVVAALAAAAYFLYSPRLEQILRRFRN
jgi:hypothetical protein